MKKDLFLGIDLGTQSIKLGVYDISGEQIVMSSASYPTFHNEKGYAEQNPNDWLNGFEISLNDLKSKIDISQIKAISICATSSTVILTDKNLTPILPAQCWMDQRCINEENEINSNLNIKLKEFLTYSGGKVSVEWMITKSLWLYKNFDLKDKYIVEQLDWMNYQLTGKLVASKCNATCKWLYVEDKGGFSTEIFNILGMPNILDSWPSEILEVGELIGCITDDFAKKYGFSPTVQVFQGGIDAHIGMIGLGGIDQGVLNIITGTSFVHLIHHKNQIKHDGLWGPYDSPLINNSWLFEGGQLSCGSLISWYLQEFGFNSVNTKQDIHQFLENKAREIPIGSQGLYILDSWKGNRTPYKNPYASGAFVGLMLHHNKYHIYRAILESIIYGTFNIIKTIRETGIDINHIVVGGGLAKNHLLMQMLSDISETEVYMPHTNESGINGAAVIAIHGYTNSQDLVTLTNSLIKKVKICSPSKENSLLYQKNFEIYVNLNELLTPIMKTIKVEIQDFK